jgi:lipid-A-disaccharide synthase
MKPLKLYVVAGEASGDLHGSNMMNALLEENPNIQFRFWGGDRMKAIQPDGLAKHIKELAFMGFIEVLANLGTILKNISFCKKDIEAYQPDAIVLVDYPGFNLRIAEWAKSKGIKVYYYISPSIWAWKESRVHKIKRVVDHMFVILPFEKDFYAKHNCVVEYVGNPLIDEISKYKNDNTSSELRSKYKLDDRPIIAVLPGSRKQEISKKLPIMLEALKGIVTHQIVVAGAPNLEASFYESITKEAHIIYGETYSILANSDLAVVTSGTATLETALFKVPEVVCYKGAEISYRIAKKLIKVDYISLVNLIMGKEVVKELIQKDCNPTLIRKEIDLLMNDTAYRKSMENSYDILEEMLGGVGASKKVAQSLLKTIS